MIGRNYHLLEYLRILYKFIYALMEILKSDSSFYVNFGGLSHKTGKRQKEFLRTKLKDWMKEHAQTDDITVVGIRL